VLTIRDLADRVTQHVFADFGTFLLDRTVKSFTGADERLLFGAPRQPAEEILAHGEQGWAGKTAKPPHLELRLTSNQASSVH
jgi:hypothetical protein